MVILYTTQTQTKGVVQEWLFSRFSIGLSALSGATILVKNQPVKDRIGTETQYKIGVGNRITSPEIKPRG